MNAFMDARCPKCSKRFGWRGKVTDRPARPKCGHQVERAQLERDQATTDRALSAASRPSFCGVAGHTEADECGAPYIHGAASAAITRWCRACAREKRGPSA